VLKPATKAELGTQREKLNHLSIKAQMDLSESMRHYFLSNKSILIYFCELFLLTF
jgi:hypothetical protein